MICKLNWLFISFTYLPNFIIWLPSFSSPWLEQLASRFRSIKSSIFCEIICVSKRNLVILIRMLYCTTFFKIKSFVILFFLSFVWFISREGIWLGVIFPGGNYLGVKILGGNFTGGSFHRWEYSQGVIFIGCNFLGDNFPDTIWCIQISRGNRRITYKSEFCFISKSKLYKKN